jgi:hypothetical protein
MYRTSTRFTKNDHSSQGGYKNREKLKMQNAFLLSEQYISVDNDVVVCGVVRGVARNTPGDSSSKTIILPRTVAVRYLIATRCLMPL